LRKENLSKTAAIYGHRLADIQSRKLLRVGSVVILIIIGIASASFFAPYSFILRLPGLSLAAVTIGVVFIGWVWCRQESERKLEKLISIHRRAKKRIDYLESILQDSTDIIFTVDTEGFILKFNKGAELHFGYTQAEVVGKPLGRLFVNEADERKTLGAVLLKGKSIDEEVPMKTAQGEILLLNLSVSEMKIDGGEIIGLVATAKDITDKKNLELELRRKNEQLGKLAITDSLTELYNFRYFHEQLNRELRRLERNPDRKLSLILIDIDNFKQLNDTEGHQAGDQVLRALAQVIKVCIRKDIDTGHRYGGDEFVIILPDTDKRQALVVAERVRKQFGAFRFGSTALSIGVSEAIPEEPDKDLIQRADEAMYNSKKAGKGGIVTA